MMSAGVPRDYNPGPADMDLAGQQRQPGSPLGTDSMPPLPQLYALPIHHTGHEHKVQSHVYEAPGSQTPRAETSLRRKTPNGTIYAGYDGTGAGANPQKHQLLPLSDRPESHVSHASHPSDGVVKRTFLQHQQRRQGIPEAWTDGISGSWPGHQHLQSHGPVPVMDSVLNQLPSQTFHPEQYYGQTVPSVIQPSFQYIGPTASGGQGSGPYGPYWHDGTFVPYRPAALRDPRFYHHPISTWQGPLPGALLPHQGLLWSPAVQQHTSFAQQPDRAWPGVAHFHTQPGSSSVPHFVGHRPFPADLTHAYPKQTGANDVRQFVFGAASATQSTVAADYGPLSPNGQQRDTTFSWALQQYRDLLTFIHQTRRQQQQARHSHGQSNVTQRPSFYPRPPRQSPASSALNVNKRRPSAPERRTTSDATAASASFGSAGAHGELDAPTLRSTSIRHPNTIHVHDNEYQRRASHEHDRSRSLASQPEKWRTLRRSSGSSISPMHSSVPQDDSPPSRAALALSYMTESCHENNWQWTDGMHLGGCLAYALGDYPKALRWYKKVLEMDTGHLEATSNLAATLLALGQNSEAEQHWVKVVKAAPNHFEAVEHLIGLLCNERRSKDAVKVIEYVERTLRQNRNPGLLNVLDRHSECSSSTASRSPLSELSDRISYDFDVDGEASVPGWRETVGSSEPGFGSSGFAIPGCDNGRMLALIHAKGNMLYGLGDNGGAAKAFEDAVLIAAGRSFNDVQSLVDHILSVVTSSLHERTSDRKDSRSAQTDPILLTPEQALATAKLCFPIFGELPGLQHVAGGPQSIARRAVVSTTSNSLLSLAKIFQDGMSNSSRSAGVKPMAAGVRDILALYYLSLALQPSPSTANNVGILLASVQQVTLPLQPATRVEVPGVVPGSGIALALQYYNYGLQLDQNHAHLYTNLGSLLKDIGQLDAAVAMYERAVKCDGKFDIALANLANAVKDKGRISDAIVYYKRAVEVSPDFAEAVCGLANALNSICSWQGRGGVVIDGGKRDRWHVNANGMLLDAKQPGASGDGWIKGVLDIVEKQLVEGQSWGCGTLTASLMEQLVQQLVILEGPREDVREREAQLRTTLQNWAGRKWEGARISRLIERATKRIGWYWYQDLYVRKESRTPSSYNRPPLPASLTIPSAPTVLPFHTFTCPVSAKQVRLISQRNGLRISVCTLRSPWLPTQVYPPPKPPAPFLRVGYVSSDFNNHPLAHLMQSVFGLHDRGRVEAYCYATTAGDNSVHRKQIEAEAPNFHDASAWSAERLISQIVQDGIHILINLNGYTRGARNEIFAARPAPVQMSFMGYAGTMGAEWCDYLLADETAVPPETLRPWRRNVDIEDQMTDDNHGEDNDDWVYGENIIYCRDTFFCCDHRQSAPDAKQPRLSWEEEQERRWQMRRELFPQLPAETVVFGNFNQLYKIEPTTFRTWLRILANVPNSVLWLLRFPDLGESHLLTTAERWAGAEVASRVLFTDVAPKHLHISRARVCDLVLDTPECNAHTTAADVLWSGTPLLTLPRYEYKMCSRMAASILKGALPATDVGRRAATELIAADEEDYEHKAIALGRGLSYISNGGDDGQQRHGRGRGRLVELRRMLYDARWTSALFDTARWVADLEDAYHEAWRRYVAGQGGDIWLDQIPRGRRRCERA